MLTREFDRVCCKVDDDEPHIEFANYSRYDRFINLSSVTVYQTYVRLCDCKYMTPVVYTSYAVGNWQNAFDSMYMDTPVGPFPPQTLIDMLNRGDGNNNGIWYKLIAHVLWAGARVRLLLLRELLASTCADLYGLIAQHFIVFFLIARAAMLLHVQLCYCTRTTTYATVTSTCHSADGLKANTFKLSSCKFTKPNFA